MWMIDTVYLRENPVCCHTVSFSVVIKATSKVTGIFSNGALNDHKNYPLFIDALTTVAEIFSMEV